MKVHKLAALAALSLLTSAALAAEPPKSPPKPPIDCGAAEAKIKKLVAEMDLACTKDADCVLLEQGLGCPFGCSHVVAKRYLGTSSHKDLVARADEYRRQCPHCIYDCDAAPKQDQIVCREKKCVDGRYAK